jgi:hypothetical protein
MKEFIQSGCDIQVWEPFSSVPVHVITTLDPQMKEFIQSGGDIQVWKLFKVVSLLCRSKSGSGFFVAEKCRLWV